MYLVRDLYNSVYSSGPVDSISPQPWYVETQNHIRNILSLVIVSTKIVHTIRALQTPSFFTEVRWRSWILGKFLTENVCINACERACPILLVQGGHYCNGNFFWQSYWTCDMANVSILSLELAVLFPSGAKISAHFGCEVFRHKHTSFWVYCDFSIFGLPKLYKCNPCTLVWLNRKLPVGPKSHYFSTKQRLLIQACLICRFKKIQGKKK